MLRILLIAMLFCLGGCATSGAIEIDCPKFDDPNPELSLRQKLPLTRLERQIRGEDLGTGMVEHASNALDPVLERALLDVETANFLPGTERNLLLLSGGGQWGAFGAGFLSQLEKNGRLPEFQAITGVSTGGLQSLFLAVGKPGAFVAMLTAYSPSQEDEIVNRHAQWQAAVRGSIAELAPLRRRIEETLCSDPMSDARCFLDDLREVSIPVLIGFIEAESGDFYFVDAARLARIPDKHMAQQCLTGAALASAAMPVFFQQVRINGKAYYDGGVRQSVFEAAVAESVTQAARKSFERPQGAIQTHLYVVRNGPTALAADEGPDKKADALTNALRAEAIVVNQLEVSSISALRLEHPFGPIALVTADRWNEHQWEDGTTCVKTGGVMFEPNFMKCLQHFGAEKASSNEPWTRLEALEQDTPESWAPTSGRGAGS